MRARPRGGQHRRTGAHTTRAALLMVLLALAAAACSADDEGASTDTTGPQDAAAQDERIVVIGEEYLLADLLALGIEPVAATATVADEGFHGVDSYDTSDIRALPATEPNLELLASLEPDHIVILEFFADEVGVGVLEGIADEVTVVPDGLGPVELVELYGEMFGEEARVAELVEEYEGAMAKASEELGDRSVSVAAIYAGPSVSAFVEGPWAVPATLVEAGAELAPTPEQATPDANGRAYLSMEQVGLLDAPQMLLLQTPLVEGESQAVEEVAGSELWQTLPAVAADEVTELDRLGYPGIEGRIRLVDDLVAALVPPPG